LSKDSDRIGDTEFIDRNNVFKTLEDVSVKNPEYILNFGLEQALIKEVEN